MLYNYLYLYFNFFMYVYGQLSAIKNLLLLYKYCEHNMIHNSINNRSLYIMLYSNHLHSQGISNLINATALFLTFIQSFHSPPSFPPPVCPIYDIQVFLHLILHSSTNFFSEVLPKREFECSDAELKLLKSYVTFIALF